MVEDMNAHTCLVLSDEHTCTRPRGHKGQHVAHAPDGVTVLATWEADPPDGLVAVLDALGHAHRDHARSTTRRDRLVHEARSMGATWAQIGSTLGISAQGAQKRYGTGQERQEAHDARQAARKAARAAQKPDTPTSVDPWPDGTVQGTI
jgi:hypothetical protein